MPVSAQIGIGVGWLLLFVWVRLEMKCKPHPTADIIDVLIGTVMPAVSLGIIICSFFFGLISQRQTEEEYYNSIRTCVNEQGYTVWINGTEVDLQHITIEDYAMKIISIEDEIKEIHIAANTKQ